MGRGAKLLTMRCQYCQEHASWFRRMCADCRRLLDLYTQHKGQLSPIQFLDLFIETGLSREKIEAFMNADPKGEGSVTDQITADMSTELLGAMGINAPQRAQDVKDIRAQGNWRKMDERPEE